MLFRFASPELLWLLVIVLLIPFFKGRKGSRASVRFPAVGLAKQIAAFVRNKPGGFLVPLRLLSLTLLVLALARPQTGEEITSIKSSGIDIVMAVDLSTSMWAMDFEIQGVPQDRLTVLKSVIEEFIQKRRDDRIGLIAFAADPYLVSPLTLNHDWLLKRVAELEIGSIEDGTAIGSAIGAGVNRLRDLEAESRVLILLTDGANNRGQISPVAAAEAAAAFNIKIYAIGVGREGPVRYPAGFDARGRPQSNRRGEVFVRTVNSSIDLQTLQQVAERSNGAYFHATDTEALRQIYERIDELEKTEVELNIRAIYQEVFWIPLLGAFGLFLVEWLLAQSRYRRMP